MQYNKMSIIGYHFKYIELFSEVSTQKKIEIKFVKTRPGVSFKGFFALQSYWSIRKIILLECHVCLISKLYLEGL